MEIFIYFFLAFFLVAGVIALITKKRFLFCLGNMTMLAAGVIIIWSFIIDDGSRRGMDAVVIGIMWAMAAGAFLVGFILRKIGASLKGRKATEDESPAKTTEQDL